MKMQSLIQLGSLASPSAAYLALLMVAGCATAPTANNPMQEDKVAQTKSQSYFDGVNYAVPAPTNVTCLVPAGAEKPQMAVAGQPSKNWKELVSRASACVNEKNWAKLETIGNLLARNDLDSPWGAYFLSVVAEANADYPRAIWMAELAQKKAGGRAALFYYQRGHTFLVMKETVKGMADFEKALSLDPTLAQAHLYLGEIYHRDQELQKAVQHYSGVLATEPKNYAALTGIAECKLRLGSGAEAADFYQRALAVSQREIQPWIRLAYIYETVQKNPEQALNTYRGLKTGLDRGAVQGHADFDLGGKIKALEQAVAPRIPAQASAGPVSNTGLNSNGNTNGKSIPGSGKAAPGSDRSKQ